MDLQSPVVMSVGQMGSGKTHHNREILSTYCEQNLAPLIVILNTTRQLSEYAYHREVFNLERLERGYSAEAIADLIRHHKRVHFEVPDYGEDMADFLEQFFKAINSLGVFEADGCTVLLVVDESHVFFPKFMFSREAKILVTESRKFGIHILLSTQKLASTSKYTIHQLVLNAVNVWVVFPTSEVNNRKAIEATIHSSIPDPALYAMPIPNGEHPERSFGPEYLVIDRLNNKRGFVQRQADGTRVLMPLAA